MPDRIASVQSAFDQETRFSRFDIAVIGASAGGIAALKFLLSLIPVDLPVPIVIVQHRPTNRSSMLPQILNSHSPLMKRFSRQSVVRSPNKKFCSCTNR
ncbi:MAG: hypothetical protein JOZ31_23690 [Verrucomicrobia bacterium]|nr:hypothetical protein [Verrucomicrobiota bacterium]MBV8481963.1 hypothetical protein [Verrucomicrobiota bacterium]